MGVPPCAVPILDLANRGFPSLDAERCIMNILHPDTTPAKCRETYSKVDYEFPTPTFHTAQELAEMSLAQTREAYERSKSAPRSEPRHFGEVF